ncbi:MAG: hypothetical protein KAI80_05900 [Hyphomicrobiaceae bacterium]|nr:hypothetical protein [Hyphomicrobiaceae bacterium]
MDGNLRALDRYLDELDRAAGYESACREIEDAILEAAPDSKIGHYYGEELAEWQERIGEYRSNGGRGHMMDWEHDEELWQIVHG